MPEIEIDFSLLVEALVSDIHVVTMRLEPQVSAGAEAMFGRSPSELLQLLRETDPDDFGEGELRRQLEALRQIPGSLVSAPGSEEGAGDHPERDAVDLGDRRTPLRIVAAIPARATIPQTVHRTADGYAFVRLAPACAWSSPNS